MYCIDALSCGPGDPSSFEARLSCGKKSCHAPPPPPHRLRMMLMLMLLLLLLLLMLMLMLLPLMLLVLHSNAASSACAELSASEVPELVGSRCQRSSALAAWAARARHSPCTGLTMRAEQVARDAMTHTSSSSSSSSSSSNTMRYEAMRQDALRRDAMP